MAITWQAGARRVGQVARHLVTPGHSALTRRRLRELAESIVVGLALNRDGRRPTEARRFFFDAARLVTPTMLVHGNGVSYFVSTEDRIVSRQTFAIGSFEEELMARAFAALEQRGQPVRGRAFIDVGAHIGTSTIPAVTRFGASRGLAIEPDMGNFALLRCNVLINGLEGRVTTVQAAASDQVGTGVLSLSAGNSGDHQLRHVKTAPAADRRLSR